MTPEQRWMLDLQERIEDVARWCEELQVEVDELRGMIDGIIGDDLDNRVAALVDDPDL